MKLFKSLITILILIGLASLYYFKDNIKKSSIFKLKKIVITDVQHYSFNTLVNRVTKEKKISIFDIDLKDVEKNFLELSWIKKVRVTRVLPNKINVLLKEHRIKGIILFDELYFYDTQYHIFLQAFPNEIKNKIIYTGLTMNNYENNFKLFKNKLLTMEKIGVLFNKSNLKEKCILSEISITLFRGYKTILKCNNDKHYINVVLGYDNYLNEFNKSQLILNVSKKRKEIVKTIIFNELKEQNSVIVKINNEESIDG